MSLDTDLEALRRGSRSWVSLSVGRKIQLLSACRAATSRIARRWTHVAATAKGTAGTLLEGEETLCGPWAVISALNHFLRTLREIERFGAPQLDARSVRARPDGQVVVEVFPSDVYDRIVLNGFRAQVWMDPTLSPAELPETIAAFYRRAGAQPSVALVLGAGNIASIPVLDVLSKLVADGAVCMLKLNPVAEYLGPIFEEALAPLASEGYVRFAYGGVDLGKYLCDHPLIDEIHITGSAGSHNAIVFGEPLLTKPISSELGSVTPTIVVPGEWSDADIRFQAEHIATQKLHNDGFNCIAAQVLVLPAQWDRTPALRDAVAGMMRDAPDRPAYYPGAAERWQRLASDRASIESFGRARDGFVPRTIVSVDARARDEPAFATEAFCSLLAVATMPGDTETYLRDAVRFANERLWGTLGANLIVHPRTLAEHRTAVDRAVADLRYGCIGINVWSGAGFLLPPIPWGAYPGHTLAEPGSGIGVVHNSRLFTRTQKSVLHGPFAPFPKPPWFITNRNQAAIAERLCAFEAAKSPLGLAALLPLALSG